jgi:NADH-quinone oxidoreductase subunit M
MSLITFILACPLIAALAIAVIPRNYKFVIRVVSLVATLLSMIAALCVFKRFDGDIPGYQFVSQIPWIQSLGISYKVGLDGLNVGLFVMGAIVAFTAAAMANEIRERQKEFYLLLMVMTFGILGAFASLDLFFFFFFHELALIPTFIMIGVWGRGSNKNYATFNITLYLTVGAMLALAGLLALQIQSGAKSFDLVEIAAAIKATPIPLSAQQWIFPLLLFGFGILVSLWPFHTWAPIAYAAAPTPTAMLHAGVLKKFGLYGLIRIALPMMPDAAQSWLHVVAFLCLGNILYCGLVAIRQKDFLLLLGNSSVAHMGFVFLGIASLTLVGLTGAVVVMVAHGLLAALTFALAGYLYKQTQTLQMERLGGFLTQIPFVGAALVMALMAGCGLPGFANFVGEAMVLFGSWKAYPLATGLAVWGGLVIGAVYMLRAIRQMLHGPTGDRVAVPIDANGPWRKLPFAILLAALIALGVYPSLLTDKIKPSADAILAQITHRVEQKPMKGKTPAPRARGQNRRP